MFSKEQEIKTAIIGLNPQLSVHNIGTPILIKGVLQAQLRFVCCCLCIVDYMLFVLFKCYCLLCNLLCVLLCCVMCYLVFLCNIFCCCCCCLCGERFTLCRGTKKAFCVFQLVSFCWYVLLYVLIFSYYYHYNYYLMLYCYCYSCGLSNINIVCYIIS